MNAQSPTKTTNVKSWLCTIARNTLIDELRRQKKWHYINIEDNEQVSTSLESNIEKSMNIENFNQALAQLPFHQKEAFIFQQEGFGVFLS
jgi:RNA polymerase sigma-70 factor (ECF subfamily)